MSDVREDEFDGRPELIKKRGRVILLQRITIITLAIYIIGSLGLLVISALASHQARDTLIDCTTIGGECYQEGQESQAKAIKQLVDAGLNGDANTQHIVVLAAACAEEDSIRTEDDQTIRTQMIEKCINDQLVAEGR